jgi:hypothetical protein
MKLYTYRAKSERELKEMLKTGFLIPLQEFNYLTNVNKQNRWRRVLSYGI